MDATPQIQLRDALVAHDLAASVEFADKLIASGRVLVRGKPAKSPTMLMPANETDIVLGARQALQMAEDSQERPDAVQTEEIKAPLKPVLSICQERYNLSKPLVIQRLISEGAITSGGTTITNAESLVDNLEIQQLPASKWLMVLFSMTEKDALSAIADARVGSSQGVITVEKPLPPFVASSLEVLPSAANASLKFKTRNLFRSAEGALKNIKLPTPMVADVLVQNDMAKSVDHARYLCSKGRVFVGDMLVSSHMAPYNSMQPIRVTPRLREAELTTEEQAMFTFVEKFATHFSNAPLRAMEVRKFITTEGVTESFVAVAFGEFGAAHGLEWNTKLGLCWRVWTGNKGNVLDAQQSELDSNVQIDGLEESTPDEEDKHDKMEASLQSLGNVLIERNLAADDDDIDGLLNNDAVLVNGVVERDTQKLVDPASVDIVNDIKLMRRAIPRAVISTIDAHSWPQLQQKELLWTMLATSCFICNVSLEAFACGMEVGTESVIPLFLSDGPIQMTSNAAECILRGASRVMIERACTEAVARWTSNSIKGYLYKQHKPRPNELMLSPRSEYFWPLVGNYSDPVKAMEATSSFYNGEMDELKRKRFVFVLLDFTVRVSDDSLLLSDKTKNISQKEHIERVKKLANAPGLVDSPWNIAFMALTG